MTTGFEDALEYAPTGMAVLDGAGSIELVNRRLARMLRRDATDLAGRELAELVHPDDHDAAELVAKELVVGQMRDRGRIRYLRPDGTVTWGGLAISRLPDDERGAHLVAHVADLSELVRAEEQLGAVVEGLDDGLVTFDPSGMIVTANPAARRLLPELSTSPAPPSAHEWRVLDEQGNELAVEQRPVVVALETGRTAEGIIGVPRERGGVLWLAVAAHPLQRSNGERWVVATYKDVSERRRVEALAEAAMAADRAKSEFLSRMSHELRTPLNAVLGFAQLLAMGRLDSDAQESVDQILAAGRHLLGLLDEMLDLDRVESGRLELRVEPVAVGRALQEALELVQTLATASGIAIDLQGLPVHEHHVLADRQRLRQVLLNLFTNAIKYNRPSGRVTVSFRELDQTTILRVRDTGDGLTREEQGRVFTPFERLDAERRGIEGMGVGLAVSKRLVESMGGAIGVDSERGNGSTFWVMLSSAEPGSPPRDAPTPVPPEAAAALLARSGAAPRRVLYIEDNPASRRLLEQLARRSNGFELALADDGRSGLALAREYSPNAILLDLHLPDGPGEEVLRALRADPGTADTPVIVVSADATPPRIEQLRAAGATAYLTKPIDVSRLFSVLEGALAGAAGESEL